MARTSFSDGTKGDSVWTPAVDSNGAPRRVADPSKDFIEGHLMAMKDGVGKNNQRVYQVKISPDPKVAYTGFGSAGTLIDVWGCVVLDDQMDAFAASPIGGIGAWVRIEFSGRNVKKESKGKADGALQSSDLTIMYTVIGDDEIPAIKVEGTAAYKSNDTNAAPKKETPVVAKPAVAAAPLAEVPADLGGGDDDPESDDLPF